MKKRLFTNEDISVLCLGLAQLLHAGIGTGDALYLTAEDEPSAVRRKVLEDMAACADSGSGLAFCAAEAGCFPDYMCALLEVGESTGRTEEALTSLAAFYENRERLRRSVSRSLLYPAALLGVMAVVIVALLIWVLPVFDDVYAQLGGGLTGAAAVLLAVGRGLKTALPTIVVCLVILCIAAAVIYRVPALRTRTVSLFRRIGGDKGLSAKLSRARFAQALSMAVASGLDTETAVSLSSSLADGPAALSGCCADCLRRLGSGESLSRALGESGLLPRTECRLLDAGEKSGNSSLIIEKIAQRMLDNSESALEDLVGKIEPALILVTSVMVGLILFSVMLPLIDIMSAIG